MTFTVKRGKRHRASTCSRCVCLKDKKPRSSAGFCLIKPSASFMLLLRATDKHERKITFDEGLNNLRSFIHNRYLENDLQNHVSRQYQHRSV